MSERRETESSSDQECVISNVHCIEFDNQGICMYMFQILTKIIQLISFIFNKIEYLLHAVHPKMTLQIFKIVIWLHHFR